MAHTALAVFQVCMAVCLSHGKKGVSFHCKCNRKRKLWVDPGTKKPKETGSVKLPAVFPGLTGWERISWLEPINHLFTQQIFIQHHLCVWTSTQWWITVVSKGGFLTPKEPWTPAEGDQGAHSSQATSLTFTLASHRFLFLFITHSPWTEVVDMVWESGDPGFWSWCWLLRTQFLLCIEFPHSCHGNIHFCSLLLSRTILRNKCGQS